MPIYVFQHDDGRQLDRYYPMANVPLIGQVVTVDGEDWRRVPSFNLDVAGIARKTHGYPRASNTLPRNRPGTVCTPGCDSDKDGRPILRSVEHERNVLKTMGWEREDGDGVRIKPKPSTSGGRRTAK